MDEQVAGKENSFSMEIAAVTDTDDKDELIRRQKAELEILRSTLTTNQNNYESLSRDHWKLLKYLKELNTGDPAGSAADSSRQSGRASSEHSDELLELEAEKKRLADELSDAKSSLESATKRETQIKTELGLDGDATQEVVLEKIQQLKAAGEINEATLDDLRNKFEEVTHQKLVLQRRVDTLEGQHSTVKLRTRQVRQDKDRDQQVKSFSRLLNREPAGKTMPLPTANVSFNGVLGELAPPKPAPRTLGPVKHRTSLTLKPQAPIIQQASTGSSMQIGALATSSANQRCVLCRDPFPRETNCIESSTHCYIHHQVFKSGKWSCCHGGYDSLGCIRVPHLRIELSHNNILLTDGSVRTLGLK